MTENSMKKTRLVQVLSCALLAAALALAALTAATLRAQQTDRAKEIGGKLLCGIGTPLCDCKQILTQCNHVGCRNSAGMLKTLDQGVARGDSEANILQGFIAEFGTAVLSEPPKSGLNLIAWYLPGTVLFGGLLLVMFVISRWLRRGASALPAAAGEPKGVPKGISPELLARARAQASRETQD
jgi:cytochrome c-type biogenesis protein CcmH/NrfF